jgi:hypothetical protein
MIKHHMQYRLLLRIVIVQLRHNMNRKRKELRFKIKKFRNYTLVVYFYTWNEKNEYKER